MENKFAEEELLVPVASTEKEPREPQDVDAEDASFEEEEDEDFDEETEEDEDLDEESDEAESA